MDFQALPRQCLLMFKLLPTLGVRKGELLGAEWSEFDLDGATDLGPVWRLPAKRTKTAAPSSPRPQS